MTRSKARELDTAMTINKILEANSDCSPERHQELKDELFSKLTPKDIFRLVDKHLSASEFLTLLYEMSEEEIFECDS